MLLLPPPTKLISSRDTSAASAMRSHLNTPTCTYAFTAATVKRETAPKGHDLPLPVVSH
jgi:hypothetical protein